MTISTDQYAVLSKEVYKDWQKNDPVPGTEFVVREVYSDPSGFYGAIFQDTVTNELVVAFRGTQFDGDKVRDLIETDGQIFRDAHVKETA